MPTPNKLNAETAVVNQTNVTVVNRNDIHAGIVDENLRTGSKQKAYSV